MLDNASAYNPSTGVFTAPSTGVYQFTLSLAYYLPSYQVVIPTLYLGTSVIRQNRWRETYVAGAPMNKVIVWTVPMNANQTVRVRHFGNTTTIYGGGANGQATTSFAGVKIN